MLPGLPPYGPFPEQFSSTGRGQHREGLVVEFLPEGADNWVGNFQRGLTAYDRVLNVPRSNRIIVVAGGQAYELDPVTRTCERTFGAQIMQAWSIEDVLVFSNGLWMEAMGCSGLKWRSRRISWDGFRSLRLEGGKISGESWSPGDDEWKPFSLSIATGEVEGGSYPTELPQ